MYSSWCYIGGCICFFNVYYVAGIYSSNEAVILIKDDIKDSWGLNCHIGNSYFRPGAIIEVTNAKMFNAKMFDALRHKNRILEKINEHRTGNCRVKEVKA